MSQANAAVVWNRATVDIIKELGRRRQENHGVTPDDDRPDTADAARTYCLLNIAMYEALNALDYQEGSSPFPPLWVKDAPPQPASRRAAAAGAAYTVLVDRFAGAGIRSRLADLLHGSLSRVQDAPARQLGYLWGQAIAAQVLAHRRYDLLQGEGKGGSSKGPGVFDNQWSGHFRRLQPFVLSSPEQFVSDPPPPLTSSAYARDWDQVRRLGARHSTERSRDQTAAARFWAGGLGTSRPTGAWFEIALSVLRSRDCELQQSARLLFLLALAIGDSVITSWQSKWRYNLWRPQQAIRLADTDGNLRTTRDYNWVQLNASPGGSPDYTSGASTFAGAAAAILTACFGTGVGFRVSLVPHMSRHYTSFKAAAEEAAKSRTYAGIHFPFANRAGLKAGEAVAGWVLKHHPVT